MVLNLRSSHHEVAPSGAEEPGVPVPLRLLQRSRAVAALFRHSLPGPRPPLRQGRGSGHKMGAAPDVSDPHWEGTPRPVSEGQDGEEKFGQVFYSLVSGFFLALLRDTTNLFIYHARV